MEQKLNELRTLEAYYEGLRSRSSLLAAAIVELRQSISAAEALRERPTEVLASLGSGVYVKAGNVDTELFLVSIGTGIFLTMESIHARIFLEKRMREAERALVEINRQMEAVGAQIQSSRGELESMLSLLTKREKE